MTKMESGLNWSLIEHIRSIYSDVLSLCNKIIKGHCKFLALKSFNGLVASVSLVLSFLLALTWGYLYMFPKAQPVSGSSYPVAQPVSDSSYRVHNSVGECNVFQGRWIRDESYPLYNASLCPFAEHGFNCLANGQKDRGYTKWKWKPKNCNVPRFNAQEILEKLRGKRVVFVGDSLSRTQWESMICMLMTGVDDKRSVYEVNGNQITKRIRFLGVRFSSFNLRIDFYRSVFLVQPGPVPRHSPKRVKSTLRLDKMDDINKEWIDSDVLIFNSGHWWTRSKLFEMLYEEIPSEEYFHQYWICPDVSTWTSFNTVEYLLKSDRGCYFQVRGSLKLGMPTTKAFKAALDTWASWTETMINTNRTSVFFRTFESSHWSGRKRNSCKVTQRPSSESKGRDRSPISDVIIKVVRRMAVPVTVMHVTPMGAFRSDAHVGTWSDNPSVPDCSHWCLPGVPDTWNEILFSYLLSKNGTLLH